MPPIVLINSLAAGAYRAKTSAAERIGRAYAAFGIAADVKLLSREQFLPALRDARRTERPIVIAGGDGSVSAAIQLLARTGIPLGILPLGTYNLLAQDLGMAADLEQAVAQLAAGTTATIDLGYSDGRYFHTLAGLGFFARAARERASVRDRLPAVRIMGALIAAARSFALQGQLDVEIRAGADRRRVRTPALIVTNNGLDAMTWRRQRLDGATLELHAANGAMRFPLLVGGFAAIRGTWREHPGVETLSAKRIELHFRRPRVFVSLDGEVFRRNTPLVIETSPAVLTCLTGTPPIKTA